MNKKAIKKFCLNKKNKNNKNLPTKPTIGGIPAIDNKFKTKRIEIKKKDQKFFKSFKVLKNFKSKTKIIPKIQANNQM